MQCQIIEINVRVNDTNVIETAIASEILWIRIRWCWRLNLSESKTVIIWRNGWIVENIANFWLLLLVIWKWSFLSVFFCRFSEVKNVLIQSMKPVDQLNSIIELSNGQSWRNNCFGIEGQMGKFIKRWDIVYK